MFVITLAAYVRRKKYSPYIILLAIFYLIKIFINIINGVSIFNVITQFYPILGICMFIEIWMDKDVKGMFKGFNLVFMILIFISFITILIKPYGYGIEGEKIYFQRGGNQMASFCILSMVLSMIYTNIRFNKKRSAITSILLIINTYIIININSSTGIVVWSVFLLYYFLPLIKMFSKILNLKNYLIVYLIAFWGIIIFQIQEKFSYLIETILGKDLTFSSRTYLWNLSLDMFDKKPLIGYGVQESSNIIYEVKFGKMFSTHNQILQNLLESGLISIVIIFIIICLVINKINTYSKTEICNIVSVGIICVCINLFTESMGLFDLFILLCISYNIDKLFKYKKECEY